MLVQFPSCAQKAEKGYNEEARPALIPISCPISSDLVSPPEVVLTETTAQENDGVARCPVCDHEASVSVLAKDGYNISRCQRCGLLHLCPVPSEDTLSSLYQDPRYFVGQEGGGYDDYSGMRDVLVKLARRRLRTINEHFPLRGHLLDFGCAAGYFLETARDYGWQISGIELSESMAHVASHSLEIPIYITLDALPAAEFQVVSLWEVIEHLPHPVDELRRLFERMRPGGLLMLSTPNTDHWQATREPERWVGYRVPWHVSFFTRETLFHTLQKAGFQRISIQKTMSYPPFPSWLRDRSHKVRPVCAGGSVPNSPLTVTAWRALRMFGWASDFFSHPHDDPFGSLEATAFRPE